MNAITKIEVENQDQKNQKADPDQPKNEKKDDKVTPTKGTPTTPPGGPVGPSPIIKKPKPKKPFYKTASFWIWTMIGVLFFLLILGIFTGYEQIYVTSNQVENAFNADNGNNIYEINSAVQYNYGNENVIIVFTSDVSKTTYVWQWTDSDADLALWNDIQNGITSYNAQHPLSDPIAVVVVDTTPSWFWSLFFALLPWVLIFGLAFWFMKMMIDKQTQTGSMGKKQLMPQVSNIRFKDVAGYPEVKEELSEIVDFLKNPAKYSAVGARTPKGVLLSGPPGTGKTFFAKAVAGESGIPFYSISGSDFVEMFVGVGASRVRSLFKQANLSAPALIFIDELDAVGRQRGAGMGGGNDEREQTLNQLLVEMDGFQSNNGLVIIAATNRPDVLDPALKRPGRFDRSIEIRLPDVQEREAILIIYSKKGNKKFAKDVNWANLALRTPGFSAAQLENVVNEAAILSVRFNKKSIDLEIIDEAIDRVMAGPSKTNRVISLEEKEMIAYHESGHALLGLVLPKAEKVQKITIIPRGDAGGYVLMTPKKEKFVQTKSELEAKIISYLGGRAAEEIFYGKDEITTGAYSDIESATSIARRMVAEFGMSDLGPIQYEKQTGNVFLGRDYSKNKDFSDSVAHEIDQEVRKLISKAYKKAYEIIDKNKPLMDLFAKALMIKETLNAEETEYIYANHKLPQEVINFNKKNRNNKPSSTKNNVPSSAKNSEPDSIKNNNKVRKENKK